MTAFTQGPGIRPVMLATMPLSAGWMAPAAAAPVGDAQFLLVGGTASGDVTAAGGAERRADEGRPDARSASASSRPRSHPAGALSIQVAEQQITGYRIDNAVRCARYREGRSTPSW
ncbi:hypothetical protein AB0J48_07670 [Nocardia salmonicida]|uniref:hypothetical protein n=1 Tax=Nocardia salmonicida TaxID=53431 RepID=UPI003442B6A5